MMGSNPILDSNICRYISMYVETCDVPRQIKFTRFLKMQYRVIHLDDALKLISINRSVICQ